MPHKLEPLTFSQALEKILESPDSRRIMIGSKGNKLLMAQKHPIEHIESMFEREYDDTDVLVIDDDYIETIEGFDIITLKSLNQRLTFPISKEEMHSLTKKIRLNYKGRIIEVKALCEEFAIFFRLDYAKIKDPSYRMQPGYIKNLVSLGIDYKRLAEFCLRSEHISPKTRQKKQMIAEILEKELSSNTAHLGMLVKNQLIEIFDSAGEHFEDVHSFLIRYADSYSQKFPDKSDEDAQRLHLYNVTKAALLFNVLLRHIGADSITYIKEAIENRTPEEIELTAAYFSKIMNNMDENKKAYFPVLCHIIDSRSIYFASEFADGFVKIAGNKSPETGYALSLYIDAATSGQKAEPLKRALFVSKILYYTGCEDEDKHLSALVRDNRQDILKLGCLAEKPLRLLTGSEKKELIQRAMDIKLEGHYFSPGIESWLCEY